MFKTLDRDWVTATRKVLLEAEEYKSLEEYDAALEEHRAQMGGGSGTATADVPPPPPAIT
jgi:hypothetical protein